MPSKAAPGGEAMNQTENKVLPFPAPPKPPARHAITCQIGGERFAIHYQMEDLPPVTPPRVRKPPAKKPVRIR